jgi:hypothetical protein
MRVGWLIVDGMYVLICIGLVVYTKTGKRGNEDAARYAKVLWAFVGLFALGRLVYDLTR